MLFRSLRRERLQRKQRIEDDDISREEGEQLAQAVIGIDRALNALESLGPTNLEAEMEAQERADTQRWMNFLEKALGSESDSHGTGRNRGQL